MSRASRSPAIKGLALFLSLALPCAAQEFVAPPEGLFSSVAAPAATAVAALPEGWTGALPGLSPAWAQDPAARAQLAPLLVELRRQGYAVKKAPDGGAPIFVKDPGAERSQLTEADFQAAFASARAAVAQQERLLARQARDPRASPEALSVAASRLGILRGGHALYLDQAQREDADSAWRTAHARLGPDAARLAARMTAMAGALGRTAFDGALPAPGEAAQAPGAAPRALPSAWRLQPFTKRKAALAAAVALPAAGGLTAGPLAFPRPAHLAGSLGHAAYGVGNALAFAFPLPQIYKTFREGHADRFPRSRAALAAFSSLSLALLNATALGKTLWGVQNLFTALSMVAPGYLGPWLARRGAGGLSKGSAAKATAAVAAVNLGLSAAMYAAAARLMPFLLGLLNGRLIQFPLGFVRLSVPLLLVQNLIVTGALYALLFFPETIRVMRGKVPQGFSSGVSLIYFLDSALFLGWSATSVFHPGPNHLQYLIMAAFNALGTLGSFLSWLFTRAHERRASRAAPLTNQGSAAILTGKETPR